MINKIYWFAIAALLLYSAFMAGRTFEAHRHYETRKMEEQKRVEKKMKLKHGAPYAYEERGRWYFTDKKGRRCRL